MNAVFLALHVLDLEVAVHGGAEEHLAKPPLEGDALVPQLVREAARRHGGGAGHGVGWFGLGWACSRPLRRSMIAPMTTGRGKWCL